MATSSCNSEGPEVGRQNDPAAVDWVRRTGQVDAFLATLDRQLERRRRRRWGQAIGATMVLMVAGIVWTSVTPPKTLPQANRPVMALGAAAKQVLTDGSEVDLSEGADVSVAFSAASRRVALQNGMAYFRVAKSPVPFVVAAGGVEVRAVGTAFTTRLGATGEVEVVVTEGIVAIDRPAADQSAETSQGSSAPSSAGPGRSEQTVALLRAGHRLVIPPGALAPDLERRISLLTPDEISRQLDWRVAQLQFDATPLAEAIPMFNRHSKVQLRLADEAVGTVKVSGTLRGDNVVPLLRMLELEHGLTTERQGDVITIRGATGPSR